MGIPIFFVMQALRPIAISQKCMVTIWRVLSHRMAIFSLTKNLVWIWSRVPTGIPLYQEKISIALRTHVAQITHAMVFPSGSIEYRYIFLCGLFPAVYRSTLYTKLLLALYLETTTSNNQENNTTCYPYKESYIKKY